MNLQVMETLGIDKFFALGTSQGGWVVARMALLAPEKVLYLLAVPVPLLYSFTKPKTRSANS